ncbi:MAG: acyl-CoA dehydrogenase family protein [Deltaproteobacteria bacterium]|nr:acyl-CoA dehydrogenase family protein [Deltaproteobacteria bacterium]
MTPLSTAPDAVAELCGRVRKFVDGRVIPDEKILDRADPEANALMKTLQGEAKAEGLWALNLPVEIGGGGVPFMPYVYVNEIIGRSEHAMAALGTHITQDSWMLHLFGTPEQKERWLLPMARGEITPSVGMTEPEVAGSDPTGIRATATLDGDEWVVNAHKWFTTGANVAAFTTVMCVTESGAAPHQAASMILVPTDAPGYELVRIVPTMGDTKGLHCEIRLTDVRVPVSYLLGKRGQGFHIAQKRLGPGRIFHCMRWLGQAQRAFELMCSYALERKAFGSPLAQKQSVQNWIADSAAEIQAARLLTLDAARRIDEGDEARVEISLIKFFGARVLHDVIDRAIQVHGARGVSGDTPLDKMYRHARYARIYDGPDEVHRMVVSRRILKAFAVGEGWRFSG